MVNQTIETIKNEKLLPKNTGDGLKISSQTFTLHQKPINKIILEDQ